MPRRRLSRPLPRPRDIGAYLKANLRQKPLRSAGTLLLGKGFQGLCSMVYLVLAARMLGPVDFGTLVLINSFTQGIAQLVNFQSWQAIVRYGAIAYEAGDTEGMRRLLHFSVMIDMIGAVIAFCLIVFAMPLAGRLFDLPPSVIPMARIYGIAVIPLIFSSTSAGVLRLFQRFDRFALATSFSPAIRLVGTLYLWTIHGDLIDFLWLWLISIVAFRSGQTYFAWAELRKRAIRVGLPKLHRVVRGSEPGIWRFVVGTNIGSALDLAGTQLGTLAVGYFLGAAGAGLYNVAQQFSNVIIKPNTRLMIPALYPEMARLTATGETETRDRMVRGLISLIAVFAVVTFFGLWLLGKPALRLFFGAPYESAYVPMLSLSAAGLVGALCLPLEPMLLAAGKIRRTVVARIVAVFVYAASLAWLLPTDGLAGAGVAAMIYAGVAGLLFFTAARKEFMKSREAQATPAA